MSIAYTPINRMIVKLLFLLPGYLYHLIYILITPFTAVTGLVVNILIQLRLGFYIQASLFGNVMARIFSVMLIGAVESLYLTEFGVHFKSRIITIMSFISFALSIFAPIFRIPIVLIQAITITWVSLREFRNDPNYCGMQLTNVGLIFLEGILYIFAAFIPFPIRASWVNWVDLARGVTSINFIQRISFIDFNKPSILDISFLWTPDVQPITSTTDTNQTSTNSPVTSATSSTA